MGSDGHGQQVEGDGPRQDGLLLDTVDDRDRGADERVEEQDDARASSPRRRLRRALLVLGAVALVLALGASAGFWYLTDRYAGNVDRVGNVFAGIDEGSRPAAPSPARPAGAEPVTFLLVGSDTRADIVDGQLPDARSDAIMLARLAGDRRHAQVVSIPRDSWVDIPGHGKDKINAAYAFGGPSLLIQTVEQLTGVRIDHYAAISFNGLIQVTDDLGGVDVTVAETTSNGPYTFTAGLNHLNGDQARWYVGQRYDLPGGDFDRVKRQQAWIRAVVRKLVSSGTMSNPVALNRALSTLSASVATDAGFDMDKIGALVSSLAAMDPGELRFLTMPTAGGGVSKDGQQYLKVDAKRAGTLFEAVQRDEVRAWITKYRPDMLPGEVR